MKVRQLMTPVEAVAPGCSLLDAMARLISSGPLGDEVGLKCVAIVDGGGRLAGVLTQSDVVEEILFPYFVRTLANQETARPEIDGKDFRKLAAWASKIRVADVMTRDPITLHPEADLFDAADAMVSRKVKSIPVVENDEILGVVYRSSLYRELAANILGSRKACE